MSLDGCLTGNLKPLLLSSSLPRFGGWLISQELADAGDILTVFFSILTGVFFIGQALTNVQIFIESTVSAGFIYNLIDRVCWHSVTLCNTHVSTC